MRLELTGRSGLFPFKFQYFDFGGYFEPVRVVREDGIAINNKRIAFNYSTLARRSRVMGKLDTHLGSSTVLSTSTDRDYPCKMGELVRDSYTPSLSLSFSVSTLTLCLLSAGTD